MHQERYGTDIAQEAEAGDDGAEGMRLRYEVQKLHFQQVDRLRSLHEDRPCEWVHRPDLHAAEVSFSGAGAELAISRVPCLQDHLFPHLDFQDRRDIRMKPVMLRRGLVYEPFTAVDLEAFHSSSCGHGGGTQS